MLDTEVALGVEGIWMIGVRPEEVFLFSSAIADSIRNDGNTYLPDWNSLPPWKDRQNLASDCEGIESGAKL